MTLALQRRITLEAPAGEALACSKNLLARNLARTLRHVSPHPPIANAFVLTGLVRHRAGCRSAVRRHGSARPVAGRGPGRPKP